MAVIKTLNGKTPKIGKNCFIAETAVLVGDVEIGDNCSIWYGASLRGDVSKIKVGNYSNVQDNAVLHGTYEKSEVEIGDYVSVGHNAIVHGAKVGNNVLIGMSAVLMDNAVISDGTIIAAGSVILSDKHLEAGMYAGIPAKKMKDGNEEITAAAHKNAEGYLHYMDWWYKEDIINC
jgi:carbonic anhydrase/acetyltransferase-like protein (isoleucine patch superfamily)